jgi:hypothetical protein
MSDKPDFTHGPGEDVIDPSAGFVGWMAIGLLGFMGLFTAFVLIAAATHGFS